jgi:hypothetical protein
MVAFGTYVLSAVVSLLAANGLPASTYDEAACEAAGQMHAAAPAILDEDDGGLERDCSLERVPPAPAVIDCNDVRASIWVQEMIGTCDMPRPAPPTGATVAVVHNPTTPGVARICIGSCTRDSYPLRSAPRAGDDWPPLIGAATEMTPLFASSPLAERARALPSQTDGDGLERPPRA